MNRRNILSTVLLILAAACCWNVWKVWKKPVETPPRPPLVEEYVFKTLPVKQSVEIFNIGMDMPLPEKDKAIYSQLSQTGRNFAEENALERGAGPYACFSLMPDSSVLGFSLFPAISWNESIPLGHLSKEDVGKANRQVAVFERWQGRPLLESDAARISVRSLGSLVALKQIEFIDFGIAGFSSDIWDSLTRVAPVIGLRGLALFRARELFDLRKGQVVPDIAGLVVHIESIHDLENAGKAFPNLSFLCVCAPSGRILAELLNKQVMVRGFTNLRCLYIFSNRSGKLPDLANQDFIHYDVPPRLEFLCIQGALLSEINMDIYDSFARSERFVSPVTPNHLVQRRNIDIVFSGFGYANGGARAIKIFEYNEAERFWRR